MAVAIYHSSFGISVSVIMEEFQTLTLSLKLPFWSDGCGNGRCRIRPARFLHDRIWRWPRYADVGDVYA